jgi:hypothetical protein
MMGYRKWMLSTVAAVLFGVCARVDAAPLVVFDFNDLNGTADFVAANLTSTTFANGGGLTSEGFTSGAANARGWNPSAGAAESLTNLDYWTFTLSALPGYEFDVTSLVLDEWRESKGPMEFQFFAGAGLIGSELSTNAVSTNHVVGAPMTGVTSLLIRIVAWDASNNGTDADWYVDNVTINGTVREKGSTVPAPVPEPASLTLLGMGLALAARRLRASV